MLEESCGHSVTHHPAQHATKVASDGYADLHGLIDFCVHVQAFIRWEGA